MHPTVQTLASFRFAPLQCALWGHPVTTGFEHIDWFVSAELMEPPDAHATTPSGSRCCRASAPASSRRSARPTRHFVPPARREPGTVHYLFAQSAYKIQPAHDDVLARIAAEVPNARFSLVPFPRAHVRDALAARMRGAFERRGLDFDRHVHILPFLSRGALPRPGALGRPQPRFDRLVGRQHHARDHLVRRAHDHAAGRGDAQPPHPGHAAGDGARRAGGRATRTTTCVWRWRWASDRARREALRARVRERKHVLYRDRRVVEAFQRFLLDPSSLAL